MADMSYPSVSLEKIEFPLSISRGIFPSIQNIFNYYSDRLIDTHTAHKCQGLNMGLDNKQPDY